MKAVFNESQPIEHKRESKFSGQIVTILKHDPVDGMFYCKTASRDSLWAEPHELTEYSEDLKLFILKQRVLGK